MKKSLLTAGRWIVLLPAAYAGALVADLIVVIGNQFTPPGVDPRSFLMQLFIRTVGSAVAAFAFIWIGVWIAPAVKRAVAVLMLCVLVAFSVLSLLTGAGIDTGWDYWSLLVTLFAGVAAFLYVFALEAQVNRSGVSTEAQKPGQSLRPPQTSPNPVVLVSIVIAVLASVLVPVGVVLAVRATQGRRPALPATSTYTAPQPPVARVTVPYVVGMKQGDAAEVLAGCGLRVVQGDGWYYQIVTSQSPQAGTSVDRGASVTLRAE